MATNGDWKPSGFSQLRLTNYHHKLNLPRVQLFSHQWQTRTNHLRFEDPLRRFVQKTDLSIFAHLMYDMLGVGTVYISPSSD